MRDATYTFPEPVRTRRLRLTALTVEALDAWVAGDGARLHRLTGAAPATSGPPVAAADLSRFRERLRGDPTGAGWWAWLAVHRETGDPVGLVALGGPPRNDGSVTFGYAIDPRFEATGYATEAVAALFAWTFAQPGVRRLEVAIPATSVASIRVAERLGMRRVSALEDPELGEVVVYERGARSERDPFTSLHT